MKNLIKVLGIIALVAVIGFSMVGCDSLFSTPTEKDPGNPNGDGTGTGTGDPRKNAKTVIVGNSSVHTIATTGEHWFKFVGTGDPVIFETRGDVVDTYISFYEGDSNASWGDDNSGEGSNALISTGTTSGTTYYIKITPRSGTSGSYTFVVN